MATTNPITPVDGDDKLPPREVARGMPASKDGKGIGDLADADMIDAWVSNFLANQPDGTDLIAVRTAFQFGVWAEGRHGGQSFIEAEAELRSEWSSEKGRLPWNAVRDAVWAGFDRARDRRV